MWALSMRVYRVVHAGMCRGIFQGIIAKLLTFTLLLLDSVYKVNECIM